MAKESQRFEDENPDFGEGEFSPSSYRDVLVDADEARIRDMEARNGVDLGPVNKKHKQEREEAARQAIAEADNDHQIAS